MNCGPLLQLQPNVLFKILFQNTQNMIESDWQMVIEAIIYIQVSYEEAMCMYLTSSIKDLYSPMDLFNLFVSISAIGDLLK